MRNYNGIKNKKEFKFNLWEVKESTTLLKWLIKYLGHSRTRIKATLHNRGIKVNNCIVTQFDYKLNIGDKVEVSTSKKKNELKSKYLKIIYEDKFLVVVEKYSGILSMAAGHSTLNVKNVLDDYFVKSHQRCTAHVVHRLDRDTSGLMIYAKDIETEQILEHNWHNIVYDRRYIAVLSGELNINNGTIANWLKDNKAFITYSSEINNGGKYAITHYCLLDKYQGHSLVEFKLETGRKNQIRVHAADLGFPVCGDIKYGNGDNPLGRLCLHAYILCFTHPITKENLNFKTNIPRSFLSLFNQKQIK